MHVAIIGAGVAGLTCAMEFAERGATVEVFDRGERLGSSSCSWFAGGMLAPWCELQSTEPLVVQLGTESIEWWRRRFPATVLNGTLVVAHSRDSAELTQFGRRTTEFEWLDGRAIADLEPDLTGRFNKALFFRKEGHLDPRAALSTLARKLGEMDVPIRLATETSATGLRADTVVDCSGLSARSVLRELRGVKGEMLLLRLRDVTLSRPVRVLHPRIPLYIVPRDDGVFMVGATMLESDEPSRITARAMLELLSAAYALHPAFGEAEILEIGTGVRPAFRDNLPRTIWQDGVLYVNGLFRHGFLLAPALARMAAQIVLENRRFPPGDACGLS